MLQDATGFFFSAQSGKQTAWMGDTLPSGRDAEFTVTLPEGILLDDPRIHVFRDGKEIAAAGGNRYTFTAAERGAYRVEVDVAAPTFWGFSSRVTWIYSNPIYLRGA
jgi:hypothetical protein